MDRFGGWRGRRSGPAGERLLAIATVLLVVDSFLPWYGEHAVPMELSTGFGVADERTASSWSSSSGWTAGLVLCLGSALGWLVLSRWRRHVLRSVSGWVFVVGAAAGLATVVGSWLAVPSGPALTGAPAQWVLQTTGDLEREVVRDQLHTGDVNVLWGFHIGTALMAVMVLALIVVVARHERE